MLPPAMNSRSNDIVSPRHDRELEMAIGGVSGSVREVVARKAYVSSLSFSQSSRHHKLRHAHGPVAGVTRQTR